MCVFALHLYCFLLEGTGGRSFKCKTDPADFTGLIFFIASNLMEEISPNPQTVSTNI